MICRISPALVGVWNKCIPQEGPLLLGDEGAPSSRVDPVDLDPVRTPTTFKSTYLMSCRGQLSLLKLILYVMLVVR